MIQDIAPWKLDNAFSDAVPSSVDLVLDINRDGLLCSTASSLSLPSVREWHELFPLSLATLIYAFRLFKEDPTKDGDCTTASCMQAGHAALHSQTDALRSEEIRFFLVVRPWKEEGMTPDDMRRTTPSALRGADGPLPFLAATALHLFRWYVSHRFCGRCGSALRPSPRERALVCTGCSETFYPVIAPCVIVAVIDKDRLLLTRYARPDAVRLVLVAGFVEIGETAEQAAVREVMEETGLRIRNLRYAGSQPWGLSGTLAVGFFAELDGPDAIHLDTGELAEARWVNRADIPPCPDDASLTMTMIERFARGAE